jgi:hypothetical protein
MAASILEIKQAAIPAHQKCLFGEIFQKFKK